MIFGLEERAVLTARGSGGVPVAVGQVFARGFSLGIHVALDSASLRGRIPVADISIGSTVNFTEDSRAVGRANTLDGVDHAARSVVGADFEVILVFHLAGLDALAAHPFAGTTGVAIIGISDVIAALDADGGGIVPNAGRIGVAGRLVAVAVFALALASSVLVLAHQVLDTRASIFNELAHGIAAVALEVPHAVDVLITRIFSVVLGRALLVAGSSTDKAHFVGLAEGEFGDGRASVSALAVDLVPHTLRIFVAGTLSGVAEDTAVLTDLSGVEVRGGSDNALGVLRTVGDLSVGTGDAALRAVDVVSTVRRRLAGTFVGLEVA